MEAAPPPHERAMEPKNILRQLSIRKEDCREGGGGAREFGLLNLPTTCRFLVPSVVQARRAAFFATRYFIAKIEIGNGQQNVLHTMNAASL